MSSTESPSESLLIHGTCKRMAASKVCLPLSVSNDELRPPVMRVGLECDEPFLGQIVDDALNVLAIGAEIAGEPRDRLRPLRRDDRAEDLPAGAGQAEAGDQPVSGGEQRLLSRNRSRMRSVNASPAGVRSVSLICHHIMLLTS